MGTKKKAFLSHRLQIASALVLLLTAAIQKSSADSRYIDSDEDDDHCELLPPFSKPKEELKLDLKYLITQGEDFLDNFTPTSDAVLVLGNTGSGKTTVTQILAGDLTRLHAVLAPGDRVVIIDKDDRIGAPSTQSKTLIPEQVLKTSSETNQTEFSFYDCPGFADTRGPVEDIAANFFMNKVTTKIQNVKMLFLVTHSSVKTGNDRIDFDSLAKHATTFVKSLKKFSNSFALIVTKVDSFNSRGRYISDQKIIDEIVDFLKNYNQTLHSKLAFDSNNEKGLTMRKMFFVESLLEQNAITGKYLKLWFVRSPLDCGPLSESATILDTKANITYLYRQLEYASVDPENDFSYTLKEHSTEYIANLTKSINMEIVQAVDLVTKNLQERHFYTKIQPHIVHHQVSNINTELQRIVHTLSSQYVALESRNSSKSIFLQAMRTIWETFGEILPHKFERFLEWKQQYLFFLARVTQKNQNSFNRDWAIPLLYLRDSCIQKRDWYEFLVNLQEYVSSINFPSHKMQTSKVSDPSLWVDYIKNCNPALITERIKGIATTTSEAELDLLNKIMQFSATDVKVTCSDTKIVIQANFIKISSLNNHIRKCSMKIPKLYVYAAHTIFFDEQVTLIDTDVVLMAPNFKNPGTIVNSLVLEGRAAEPISPLRAKDGDNGKSWTDRNGKNGMSGRAGLPGNPGGAVFGVVELADSVLVASKGGRGGNAQSGGHGGSAKKGYVSCNEKPEKTSSRTEWFPCGTRSCPRTRKTSSHSGYDGGNGGNGGNGGKAGIGGKSSQIRIIELTQGSKTVLKMLEGENGYFGKRGEKGLGSPKANGYENDGHNCKTKEAKKKRNGSDGRDGIPNSSVLGMKSPVSSRQLIEWLHLIQYKVLFFNCSNYKTANFVHKLDTNLKLDPYFTLKFLAEESVALEKIDPSSVNSNRLLSVYKLLISKLEKYAEKNFHTSTREEQKVISMLLTSCYSSLARLNSPSRLPAIVNISNYFRIVRRKIESLKKATAYSAILEAKNDFSEDIRFKIQQATNLIQSTVADAVNKAGEDIELQLAAKMQELSEQITDTKNTFSEYSAKLEHDQPLKNILTFVSTLNFVTEIAKPYVPLTGFSTFSTISNKLQAQFGGSPAESQRVEKLLQEGERIVFELEEKQEKLKEFAPFVTNAFSFWKNVSESLSLSDYLNAPKLRETKYQVISKLKDCKYYLQDLSDNALNLKSLINAFERIQDAITLNVELYEMVERYQELNNMAGYIEKVNSAALTPVIIRDTDLARTVAQFDKAVQRNMLSLEVQKVTHAFRQWVFPFAKLYFLQEFNVPSKTIPEIGDEQLRQITHLESELEKYKASTVANHDEFVIQTNFSSSFKTSKPFFTWEGNKWRDEIENLFSGSKVNLYADIRLNGKSGWEAIKFKLIEINFKLNNSTAEMQADFDDLIEYFGISMTHSGVSYYKFGQEFFVMSGQNQTITYNFERNTNGNRLGTNQVYEKFKSGDFVLSPYTLWTLQILHAVPAQKLAKQRKIRRNDISFEMFKTFIPHIDVELVGIGTYVKGKEALQTAGGNLELEKWYERDISLKTNQNF